MENTQYDFSILTEKAKACRDDSLLLWLCGLVKPPTTTKGTLFPLGPYAAQAGLKLMISLVSLQVTSIVITTQGSNKCFNSIQALNICVVGAKTTNQVSDTMGQKGTKLQIKI